MSHGQTLQTRAQLVLAFLRLGDVVKKDADPFRERVRTKLEPAAPIRAWRLKLHSNIFRGAAPELQLDHGSQGFRHQFPTIPTGHLAGGFSSNLSDGIVDVDHVPVFVEDEKTLGNA